MGGLGLVGKVTRTLPYRPGTALPPKAPSTPVAARTTPLKNDESPGWASGLARPHTSSPTSGVSSSERPRTQERGSARPPQTPTSLPPPSAALHRCLTTSTTSNTTTTSAQCQSAVGAPHARPLALTPTGFIRPASSAGLPPPGSAHPSPPSPQCAPLHTTREQSRPPVRTSGGGDPGAGSTRAAPASAHTPSIEETGTRVGSSGGEGAAEMGHSKEEEGSLVGEPSFGGIECARQSWGATVCEGESAPPRKQTPNYFGRPASRIHTPRLLVPAIDTSVPPTPDVREVSDTAGGNTAAAEVDLLHYRAAEEEDEADEPCSIGQAAPMVLNLEDLAQCTPEVLELEIGSLDLAQLEQLESELRGVLDAQ